MQNNEVDQLREQNKEDKQSKDNEIQELLLQAHNTLTETCQQLEENFDIEIDKLK